VNCMYGSSHHLLYLLKLLKSVGWRMLAAIVLVV
jgi:hypothetical protein